MTTLIWQQYLALKRPKLINTEWTSSIQWKLNGLEKWLNDRYAIQSPFSRHILVNWMAEVQPVEKKITYMMKLWSTTSMQILYLRHHEVFCNKISHCYMRLMWYILYTFSHQLCPLTNKDNYVIFHFLSFSVTIFKWVVKELEIYIMILNNNVETSIK